MCDDCQDREDFDINETPFHDYYFCEPVTAGPLSKWCIRPRGAAGSKPSGGVDTASLCGRVKVNQGWDIELPVRLKDANKPSDFVCKKCSAALKATFTEPKKFSISGHTKGEFDCE